MNIIEVHKNTVLKHSMQQSSIIRMMKQKSYLQQLLILLLIGMNKNLEAGKYIIDEYIKKNPKQQNALIVLDIDHFKEVNDTYGHLVGNELLIALAKYLLFHTNPNDIVIRMGGDEFVIFLKNVHDDLTYPCNQLMSHLNEISLSHHGIHFSISMGVYTFSNEQNFDNIFKIADDALYHSKRNGRNRYTIKYQK